MTTIEYFYSAHSAYAYLGHARLLELCAAHGWRLLHKPMELRRAIREAKSQPVAERSQAHMDYFFGTEIKRWARYRRVAIMDKTPTYHHHPLDLSNGLLIAAIQQGADIDRLAGAVLRSHWVDDADLDDRPTLGRICHAIGIDPDPLLEAATSEPIQEIHSANTDEAIARNVFGSPTYFVNDEMFYGQDRLEIMAWTLAGDWPGR